MNDQLCQHTLSVIRDAIRFIFIRLSMAILRIGRRWNFLFSLTIPRDCSSMLSISLGIRLWWSSKQWRVEMSLWRPMVYQEFWRLEIFVNSQRISFAVFDRIVQADARFVLIESYPSAWNSRRTELDSLAIIIRKYLWRILWKEKVCLMVKDIE